jgi:hypothetical protein
MRFVIILAALFAQACGGYTQCDRLTIGNWGIYADVAYKVDGDRIIIKSNGRHVVEKLRDRALACYSQAEWDRMYGQ